MHEAFVRTGQGISSISCVVFTAGRTSFKSDCYIPLNRKPWCTRAWLFNIAHFQFLLFDPLFDQSKNRVSVADLVVFIVCVTHFLFWQKKVQ
jgi:cytochrome c oxidase assembly factor CtaG